MNTHHARRRRSDGGSLVEFALVAPVLFLLILGGIVLDSYIQAKSQLDHAASRAALTAARDSRDPCLSGDPGYIDVVNAFQGAITPAVFGSPLPSPTIECTSPVGVVTADTATPSTIASWFGQYDSTDAPSCVGGSPADGGCFLVWRAGFVKVTSQVPVHIGWAPFFNQLTISASAGERIDPYRTHDCSSQPTVPASAC